MIFKNTNKHKQDLIKDHKDSNDKDILIEILFATQQTYYKTERVRSNLSKIVWIIVFSIILSLFVSFYTASLIV